MGVYSCCSRNDANSLEVNFQHREQIRKEDIQYINQVNPDHDADKRPTLKKNPSHTSILSLTIIKSFSPLDGIKLSITNSGLIDSLRKSLDGVTYFGYHEDSTIEDNKVDFILPPTLTDQNKRYMGRYFQIAYRPIIDHYYLKDLGNGLGTFVKIIHSVLLTTNTLISIGDSFISVKFLSYETNEISNVDSLSRKNLMRSNIIQLQVHDSVNAKEQKEHTFNSSNDSTIRIGRKNNNNQIELEDPLVSKLNSIIEYAENDGWYLTDGNRLFTPSDTSTKKSTHSSEKPNHSHSTNGTWILAIDDIEITDGMVFKANSLLFMCHLAGEHKQSTDMLLF